MKFSFSYYFVPSATNPKLELQQIAELDGLYMKYSWSLESWQEWLESPTGCKLLAMALHQDRIIGFSLWQWPENGEAELYKIVIEKTFQGQGVAQEFFRETLSRLKNEGPRAVILEVEEMNLRAINFYKKLGFISLGKRRGFYSDGANALSLKLFF